MKKNIKKIFLFVAVVVTALACFAFMASAKTVLASGKCGDNVYWNYNSTTGELVISGTGPMTDYKNNDGSPFYDSYIKSVIINDGVTTIGDDAFRECDSLTEVTIGDSVTTIGNYAFYSCGSLTNVTIPDSVTTIGGSAFKGCSSLTSITVDKSNQNYSSDECGVLFNKDKTTLIQYPIDNKRTAYTIPDSVTTIGDYAFQGCDSLTEVTIPDSVTTIGDSAFRSCTSLTSVTIGNSVTTIGDYAFQGCDSLTEVTIGDSVTTIGDYAFSGCDSLTSVTIGNSVTTIGDYAFYECYNLTSVTIGNSVTTIGAYAFALCDSLTEVTIPDSVTTIGAYAFCECSKLAKVTIGNSVTTIGAYAFALCDSLTEVTIGDSVTTIGNNAFYWCDSLTEVTIPDSVTEIGNFAFSYCDSLTSVTIPDGVTTIGDSAFRSCTSLTSVTIGNSVTTIGDYAFYSCDSLTSITIPDSVTTIGEGAFCNCDSLTSVTIPDSVTTIGEGAFCNCDNLTSITVNENNQNYSSDECGVLFNKDKTTLIQYPISNKRTAYTIPDSVTTIGDSAFRSCTSLTSVTIGDSVTTIGDYAFSGCDSLTSITIPDSVTTIGDSAFRSCTSLTSVTIGNSVTTIGDYAFYDCDSLTDVYYGGTQEQWKKISIGSGNSDLTGANIHYNYCVHANKEIKSQQNATCTEIGYTAGTYCPDCKEWLDGHKEIPATNHANKESKPQQNATCTEIGYTAGTYCPDCEKWLDGHEEIPATNHANKENKPQQNATCTEIGYTAGAYCPDCEKWVEGHSIISATGHTFTEKIIDDKHLKSKATVDSAAIYKYDCAACDVISSDKTFTHGKALTLGITGKITVAQTTSSITLTWDKASNATGYRIYYKLPGDLSWRQCVSYTTATSYTFNNLPAGQSYRFAVRSAYVKADGGRIYGGYKEIATATKAVAPSKITSAQNTTAIRLTWSKCPGATGYRVFYKSGNSWKTCLNATTATSHTFTGLKAGSKFTFAVRPYIVTDSGVVWSDYTTYTASTLPAIPKTAVTSPSSGKITVKWNAVSGAEAYQLYYKTGNGAYKLYKNYFSAQTVSFSGLKSGTKYTFAVRAAKNTSGGWVFGSFTPVSVTVK